MIQVTDLMIGDYIQRDNEVHSVIKVTCDGGLAHINEYYDCYEPIPLTDEILQKIGFEPLDLHNPYYWIFKTNVNGVEFLVEAQKRAQGGRWIECLDSNFYMHIYIQIDYVHQLQHIFKICGIDKEIEL